MRSLDFAKKKKFFPHKTHSVFRLPRLMHAHAHSHQIDSIIIIQFSNIKDEPSRRIGKKESWDLGTIPSLLLKRPYRCTKCFIELPLAASLQRPVALDKEVGLRTSSWSYPPM